MTVPSIWPNNAAVASSLYAGSHDAMSPAPTSTAGPGGVGCTNGHRNHRRSVATASAGSMFGEVSGLVGGSEHAATASRATAARTVVRTRTTLMDCTPDNGGSIQTSESQGLRRARRSAQKPSRELLESFVSLGLRAFHNATHVRVESWFSPVVARRLFGRGRLADAGGLEQRRGRRLVESLIATRGQAVITP